MPNARGEITNHDVREMRKMRAEGRSDREIAKAIGCARRTVQRHTPDLRGNEKVKPQPFIPAGLLADALRYVAFVERAAVFVPLLGGRA